MSVYAYCLCEELITDALESVAGVGGAAPRLLACGRLVAVVSEFDGEAVAVTRAHVLAHERVVGRVLTETTPLPFRFGAVTSEARLRSYVAAHEPTLRAQFERVRGCVEMSVKVLWPPEAAKPEAGPETASDAAMEARTANDAAPAGAGTAFLEAKRRALRGDELQRQRAAEFESWLAARLGGVVRATHVSVRPAAALVFAAAHLVERGRLEEYRARVRAAVAEAPTLHFLTSGPWPPYSFTAENP
ncbi:MAG TPA: GvpL/GvpF family gas vesicle protein [Pyrinomonadaceae bacterium]|jgi:hypothetical protein